MTLSECIESLNTEMVKIGAANGSGFFFIGPVEALRGDGMQAYEDYIREYEFNRIQQTKDALKKARNRVSETQESEEARKKLIKAMENRIKTWTEYYRTRRPLGDRKVLRSYFPTVYDEDMEIVIVEGDTFGKYWTFDEVKNDAWIAIANNPGRWA